ncbi:MAG: glycine--tRNA ligase [Candidatus Latescibacterota bacterium]|nr:MAG: glycine--tRNA ligase [Candidatus Latescibacterota bacterium]RKY70655.1 MAG: glycine--tRNA ligase [Candidatus Latescibacterota bacterium]
MATETSNLMEKLVSLCKRRGFIFQSSEIYGGLGSCWDYGPLGVELKNNIQRLWWQAMVREHDNIVGLDASILMHPRVWEASGHVESFADLMVDCKNCKQRFRADELSSQVCPACGGPLTEARRFNLMFKTHMGPVEDEENIIYLRPETAQGIYVNYLNVMQAYRLKLPFGIAQVGKAFRNEITTSNFIFRTREFEQMEMQFFVQPGSEDEWMEKWKAERWDFYLQLGLNKDSLRFRQHGPDELVFYAKEAWDIEYQFPFGWKEIEGIHNRTDFDLSRHAKYSGKDLSYFDEATRQRFIPYIIETSAGLTRTLLTVLVDAYDEEPERVVLHLHPRLAPIKAGVFPLVRRNGMPQRAKQIYEMLKPHFTVFYDESGSIGRRYRRMDEIGTPFGITVDSQTAQDDTVTLRDRDTMQQVRVKIDALKEELEKRIND